MTGGILTKTLETVAYKKISMWILPQKWCPFRNANLTQYTPEGLSPYWRWVLENPLRANNKFNGNYLTGAEFEPNDQPAQVSSYGELLFRTPSRIHAMVLDVDQKPLSKNFIHQELSHLSYLAWTTFNSTKENPRWRIVIPLLDPISVHTYAVLWGVMNHTLVGALDPRTRINTNYLGLCPIVPPDDTDYQSMHNTGAVLRCDF